MPRATATDATAFGMLLRLSGGHVLHNAVTAAPGWPQAPGASAVGIHLSGQNGVVRHNTATGHTDGFLVVAGGLRLLDNFAFENLDDGIDVDVSGNRLTRNTANDNGDLGIEAVPATIDGRGNRARGNGNPLECVGVRCR